MFNFKETEAAKGVSFLTPGVWPLKPVKVELGKFPQKQTPYLGITFSNEEGTEYTEKFVLSEKALGRLQYLHEAFFGKKCTQNFSSEEELMKYFKKYLTGKEVVKNFIIGGEISNGTVYATLPYTNFIVTDEMELEPGEFEEGSDLWKKFVKKRINTSGGEVAQENGLLNSDDDDLAIGGGDKEETPKGNGKKGAAATPAASTKKTTKKEEPAAETADDSLPW